MRECKRCGHAVAGKPEEEKPMDLSGGEFPGEPDEVFYNRESAPDNEHAGCGAGGVNGDDGYQCEELPVGAVFAAATPVMNEKNVPAPILRRHMAPRGKCGLLVVGSGSLRFVWEDTGETFVAAPGHPVVIFPERYHHVVTTGSVEFKIEFYKLPETPASDPDAIRPGEQFIKDSTGEPGDCQHE